MQPSGPAAPFAPEAGAVLPAPPRVTVIIPTFNWSSVLPFSVGSALGQTFRDLEVLVVGDGCTDDSEAVVGAIDDPRLRWINLPENTGHQYGPNNEGLRQARGELVAYLGHDDLWLPGHLALLVAALDRGADLAHGITALVHPDGSLQTYAGRFRFRPGHTPPPSSVVHRRTVTDAVGNWKPHTELREDPEVDLWRRAHHAGYRVVSVPRLTVVKFPAAWRRDAYRTKACHEQATWFRRIQEEPDLEAVELGRILGATGYRSALRNGPYVDLLRQVVARPVGKVRYWLFHPALFLSGLKKGGRIAVRQEFKGLKPGRTR